MHSHDGNERERGGQSEILAASELEVGWRRGLICDYIADALLLLG
ncbi:hypothetical protein [Nonomuraea sp. NEAU-A123]|nr:hypothetical protein [Nonomuraea sp. NEAU-A123]